MPNVRHERVRELLKREIGEAIRREFHVNDVGIITVNDVDVGGDLKSTSRSAACRCSTITGFASRDSSARRSS
jgi:hypothetical protein